MDVRDMRDTDITHMNKLSCTLAGQCQQLPMTVFFFSDGQSDFQGA